jgi:hypothetical protein
MKARFPALSMTSMDKNWVMRSLFTKKAMTPRMNRMTLRIKK